MELSQHERAWAEINIGYLFTYPTIPYRIIRKFLRPGITVLAMKPPKSSQINMLQRPSKWHICKEGQAGNKKKSQRRGSILFYELPSRPSSGSRSK
jgi:hypothetical protein